MTSLPLTADEVPRCVYCSQPLSYRAGRVLAVTFFTKSRRKFDGPFHRTCSKKHAGWLRQQGHAVRYMSGNYHLDEEP